MALELNKKEDKTMNKILKDIRFVAAMLLATVSFAACSGDEDIVAEQPAGQQTYTMTIQASKGDAQTRGLASDEDRTYINVNWNGTEKVRVVQNGQMVGTLSAASSVDGNTTLTGTVTSVVQDGDLKFYLLAGDDAKLDYTGQNGALLRLSGTPGNLEEKYDFAEGTLTRYEFRVDDKTGVISNSHNSKLTFTSSQAIVRFDLQKAANNIGTEWTDLFATKLILTDKKSGKLVQTYDPLTDTKTYGHIFVTPSSGTGYRLYAAVNLDAASDIMLQALDSDGNLYTYEKSNVNFEKGKYYRVTVKMHLCTKFPLDQITYEDTHFTGWYVGSTDEYAYKLYGSSVKAVIAYVGKVPGYFNNFLALGMHDSNNKGEDGDWITNWKSHTGYILKYAENHPITIGSTAYTTSFKSYENGNYYTYDEVSNSTTTPSNSYTGEARIGWRIPTITDWRYILYGLCGTPSPTDPVGVTDKSYLGTSNPLPKLNGDYDGYNANLKDTYYYCTGSGVSGSSDQVWFINFSQYGNAPYIHISENGNTNCYLRPVFAY